MGHPLTDNDSTRFATAHRANRNNPGYHIVSPEFDELFEDSFELITDVLHALLGDRDLAVDRAEMALTDMGTTWLYVDHSLEFATALAVVFAVRLRANEEFGRRATELGQERRQGRSLSSANDVRPDYPAWLGRYLRALSPERRDILIRAIAPLDLPDLVPLLAEDTLRVAVTTARLWRRAARRHAYDNEEWT